MMDGQIVAAHIKLFLRLVLCCHRLQAEHGVNDNLANVGEYFRTYIVFNKISLRDTKLHTWLRSDHVFSKIYYGSMKYDSYFPHFIAHPSHKLPSKLRKSPSKKVNFTQIHNLLTLLCIDDSEANLFGIAYPHKSGNPKKSLNLFRNQCWMIFLLTAISHFAVFILFCYSLTQTK